MSMRKDDKMLWNSLEYWMVAVIEKWNVRHEWLEPRHGKMCRQEDDVIPWKCRKMLSRRQCLIMLFAETDV